MTPGASPPGWLRVNAYTYLGFRDQRIVAIAYWTPPEPAMATTVEAPDGPAEPVIDEAGYYMTLVDEPHGKWFASGPAPEGDWPEEVIWARDRLFREWALWPDGFEDESEES